MTSYELPYGKNYTVAQWQLIDVVAASVLRVADLLHVSSEVPVKATNGILKV